MDHVASRGHKYCRYVWCCSCYLKCIEKGCPHCAKELNEETTFRIDQLHPYLLPITELKTQVEIKQEYHQQLNNSIRDFNGFHMDAVEQYDESYHPHDYYLTRDNMMKDLDTMKKLIQICHPRTPLNSRTSLLTAKSNTSSCCQSSTLIYYEDFSGFPHTNKWITYVNLKQCTIEVLKACIITTFGYSFQIKLLHKGQWLTKDKKRLEEYKINEGDTITIV